MTERMEPRQFHEASGIEDWRVVGEGRVRTSGPGSFAAGASLVDAISDLTDLGHPDPDS